MKNQLFKSMQNVKLHLDTILYPAKGSMESGEGIGTDDVSLIPPGVCLYPIAYPYLWMVDNHEHTKLN